MSDTNVKHAGLLIPLDMFRISQMAALLAEQLVSKARNILDARLVLTRHPEAPILLVRIEGHVVGDDPPAFWRENVDLVALVSRMFPRQVILYYVEPGPPSARREGFMVAQQGQVLAADDATPDRMPPGATEADWPVSRLCQQMRVSMQELADGFPGGPSVEVSLVEPAVDDQSLLMTLLGRDEEEPAAPAGGGAAAAQAAKRPGGGATAAQARAQASRLAAEEDAKRRAKQQAAQEEEQQRRKDQVSAELPFTEDDLGLVVAPRAELSEPDILRPYIRATVEGDLPPGLPSRLVDRMQGKRLDLAIRVDFLSEVFVENTPLARPVFEERAQTREVGGRSLRVIEVLAPRLGYGTLVSDGKKHVFVSRKLELPIPGPVVLELLDR